MMSFILLDELLKTSFQDSSNKIKPLFENKAVFCKTVIWKTIRSIRTIRVQKKTEHFVFKKNVYDSLQGWKL